MEFVNFLRPWQYNKAWVICLENESNSETDLHVDSYKSWRTCVVVKQIQSNPISRNWSNSNVYLLYL